MGFPILPLQPGASVTIDKAAKTVTIVLPLNDPPKATKGGGLSLAGTGGNRVVPEKHDGQEVMVGVNVFISKPAAATTPVAATPATV
jgi:hypothetical protein